MKPAQQEQVQFAAIPLHGLHIDHSPFACWILPVNFEVANHQVFGWSTSWQTCSCTAGKHPAACHWVASQQARNLRRCSLSRIKSNRSETIAKSANMVVQWPVWHLWHLVRECLSKGLDRRWRADIHRYDTWLLSYYTWMQANCLIYIYICFMLSLFLASNKTAEY